MLQKSEVWQRFIDLLWRCESKKQIDELLHLFLTMNERDYLTSRYEIVEAVLVSGLAQREMANRLNVSITKITDGSKAVQIISDPLRKFLLKEMSPKNVKKPTRKINCEAATKPK